jgi:hypothetical protein
MVRRSTWRNGALAAVVAVLGIYIYFKPARAPDEYPLSSLKPQEIRSIRVERPGDSAPLLLERRRDGWYVASPFAARADALRAHQVLAIAEAKSLHRLPATDLGRFELDRPVAWVTLAGQTFSFGLVNAITREQYVLSGDFVYTLHPRYGAALPARPADAANRQLFAADETPVRMEFPDFTVEQRDGKWRLTPGVGALSQDDFMRWVDDWHLASALRVEPWAGRRPFAEIRVRLKTGGNITLGVIARQPELVLVRSDEKMQYHLRAESAKRLFSPPSISRDEPVKKK